MTKQPKFEIHRARNKEYFFLLKSKNGKVIATGETYKSKQSVNKAISAIFDIFYDEIVDGVIAETIDKTKGKK